jgi:hypothetical protein
VAKYSIGHVVSDDLPDIATKGLEEGLESPSLQMLARFTIDESRYEGKKYFERALDELNISFPDDRTAALQYAFGIVEDILTNERDILEGTREIVNKALDAYDFFNESSDYCYDSIGFAKAYGLYDTLDDPPDISYLDSGVSLTQLLYKSRKELMEELNNWKKKEQTFYNIS